VPYRRTPQVQARLDERRNRILAAAADQLAEAGYGGCSISAVAARAGVSPGTLYNYVNGKGELAAEVFRAVADAELAEVRAAVAAATGAVEQLTAAVETFATRAVKAPRLAYALLAEPVDPAVDEIRLLFRRELRDVLAEVVSGGVRCGSLPPQDVEVVSAALVGAIAEALLGPLRTGADTGFLATVVAFAHRAVGAAHEA
jgi:AcrR family transcriptional regulator